MAPVFLQNLNEADTDWVQRMLRLNPNFPKEEELLRISQIILGKKLLRPLSFTSPLTPFKKSFWSMAASFSNADAIVGEYERILETEPENTLGKEETNKPLLCFATAHRCTKIVQFLLSGGLDPNSPNSAMETSLHLAALNGELEKIDQYVKRIPIWVSTNTDIPTPLHFAALEGREEAIRSLLEQGQDLIPEAEHISQKMKLPTPLHLAIAYGHENIVLVFLEKDPSIVEEDLNRITKNKKFVTLLQLLAIFGRKEVITSFLKKNPSFIRELDRIFLKEGIQTLLFLAVASAQIEMVKFLLGHEADINCHGAKYCPLHEAILMTGDKDNLIANADVSADSWIDILREANLLTLFDPLRNGLWMWGDFDIELLSLLLDSGADFKVKNNVGWSALYQAVDVWRSDKIKILLDKGADLMSPNARGETPFHLLIRNFADNPRETASILRVFLKKDPDLISKNAGIFSPLHWAVVDDQLQEKEQLEKIQSLINRGANCNAKDLRGNTPLHWAVVCSKVNVVKLLLKNGADPVCQNAENKTAFYLIDNKNLTREMIQSFLEEDPKLILKTDLICKKAKINTLLYKLLSCYSLEEEQKKQAIQLLLKYGAKPNFEEAKGSTARKYALSLGKIDIVHFFDRSQSIDQIVPDIPIKRMK